MPFCGQVPSLSRAREAPGDAGEREGQEPCRAPAVPPQAGPWAAGLAVLLRGAEHPAGPGAAGGKQLCRSWVRWGCVSCCGTPVPRLLT